MVRVFGPVLLAVVFMSGTANAVEIPFPTTPESKFETLHADPDVITADEAAKHAKAWSWAGFMAGVEAGYSWQSDETLAPPCFDADCAAEGDGGVFGAFVGYNHQIGSFVGGVEASYTKIGNEFDDGSQVSVDDAWSIRGRVGYAIDRFHAYALMGATHASTSVPAASPFQMLADSDWGLVYGAGVDVGITENLYAGLQYSRHHFSDFAGLGIDADMDNLMIRLGYKY